MLGTIYSMNNDLRGKCFEPVMRSFVLALVVLASPLVAADSLTFKSIETGEIRLLYSGEQSYLAPYAARSFLNSLRFQRNIFGWEPYDRPLIILSDFSDYSNGGASEIPVNSVSVEIGPSSQTFETDPGSERMFSVANHEMVHIATLDGWNGADKRWREFFGGKPRPVDAYPETILYSYLTVPRFYSPRWYAEGSATFIETWMGGGIGRAQGAYDEMVFRSMVRDDAHFYSPLGLVSAGTAADFQTMTNAYLYGTRFISFLALKESPEKVIHWLRRDADSHGYYADQFESVFGKSIEQSWSDWIEWERRFQKANLSNIRQHPVTKSRRLSLKALGSMSKSYVDPASKALVGAFFYPGVLAHVGAVSLTDGSLRRFVDIKGPMKYKVASTAFDPQSRTFFYTADNLAYRDLMALDLETGDSRLLLEDARIGDLAFNAADRSLWGLRHHNGYVTLVRIPFPYTAFNQVHTFAYGTIPFDIDLSPDGKLLSSSMEETDGKQFLRVYQVRDLLENKVEPQRQFDFGQAVPEGFVFSPDGRFLFGSAYYTGISNIYRYELSTGDIEAVSNAETGYFRPMPQADGSLIVLEHTGQGFVPTVIDPVPLKDLSSISFLGAEIARQHPVVMTWGVGSPDAVELEPMITSTRDYTPADAMAYQGGYPVIEGYKDSVALGWHLGFADPIGIESLGITASYSPTESLPAGDRLHLNIDYKTLNWRARYWHNNASFYDLFGPTKRGLKGDAYHLGYHKPIILDDPRRLEFSADAAYFTGLDTAPGHQNVLSTYDTMRTLRAGLNYTNTYRSANSVDHESGLRWSVSPSYVGAGSDDILGLRGGFDVGFPLPLAHSSLWLYSAAGRLNGNRSNSQGNYYFGGFKNNYVDDGDVKRYRGYDTFPGFEIDEISGQTFVKSFFELNLPPIRFEEVGTPGLYLSWIRPALFAGVLVADGGSQVYRRSVKNLGGQLDLNINLMHRLPMTLSMGYARGFSDQGTASSEWMLSLKIMGN